MFLPQEEIITCWPGQRQREEVLTFSDVRYKLGQSRSVWSQTICCHHTPKKNWGVLVLFLPILHTWRISYSLLTIKICNNKRNQNSSKNVEFQILSCVLNLIVWDSWFDLLSTKILFTSYMLQPWTYLFFCADLNFIKNMLICLYIYPLVLFDRSKYAKRSLKVNVTWCRNHVRTFLLQLKKRQLCSLPSLALEQAVLH